MAGDFPGAPVVGNPSCSAGNVGSIVGWGNKIPHTTGQLCPHTITTEPVCSRACVPQLESLSVTTTKRIQHLAKKTPCAMAKTLHSLMHKYIQIRSDQIRSVAQSCPTLCDPMNCSTPSLPVHHQLPEFTQTHGHRVSDAIQSSHPLASPSPPAPNPSQHQSLFQWVNSSHEVAKVLEFQL